MALQSVRDCTTKCQTGHREIHSSVCKVGKAIDKNFVQDYDTIAKENIFDHPDNQKRINELILQHYYRHGQSDVLRGTCV